MNKFELKIAEKVLYSKVVLIAKQIESFINNFITEIGYKWVENKIHLVFDMPNGKDLRIVKALHCFYLR